MKKYKYLRVAVQTPKGVSEKDFQIIARKLMDAASDVAREHGLTSNFEICDHYCKPDMKWAGT